MLIRYKSNQEKIAMGLLSFMPEEKDVKVLQETMNAYKNNENWHLYLLKKDDDFVGAIGVKLTSDMRAIIQHISVNPSFRKKGKARKMIQKLSLLYKKDYKICSNENTYELFNKCNEDLNFELTDKTRP